MPKRNRSLSPLKKDQDRKSESSESESQESSSSSSETFIPSQNEIDEIIDKLLDDYKNWISMAVQESFSDPRESIEDRIKASVNALNEQCQNMAICFEEALEHKFNNKLKN